jgi:hypothetical protein
MRGSFWTAQFHRRASFLTLKRSDPAVNPPKGKVRAYLLTRPKVSATRFTTSFGVL